MKFYHVCPKSSLKDQRLTVKELLVTFFFLIIFLSERCRACDFRDYRPHTSNYDQSIKKLRTSLPTDYNLTIFLQDTASLDHCCVELQAMLSLSQSIGHLYRHSMDPLQNLTFDVLQELIFLKDCPVQESFNCEMGRWNSSHLLQNLLQHFGSFDTKYDQKKCNFGRCTLYTCVTGHVEAALPTVTHATFASVEEPGTFANGSNATLPARSYATNRTSSLTNGTLATGTIATNRSSSLTSGTLATETNATNRSSSLTNGTLATGTNATNPSPSLTSGTLATETNATNRSSSLTSGTLATDATNRSSSLTNGTLATGTNATNRNSSLTNGTLATGTNATNRSSSLTNGTLATGTNATNRSSSLTNGTLATGTNATNPSPSLTSGTLATETNASSTSLNNTIGNMAATIGCNTVTSPLTNQTVAIILVASVLFNMMLLGCLLKRNRQPAPPQMTEMEPLSSTIVEQ